MSVPVEIGTRLRALEHRRPRHHDYDVVVRKLGRKPLDDISTEDIQRLKHGLREKAVKTVNNVLTVLNMLLKKAVEWKVLDVMPCAIKLLKVPEGSIDFYDFDEYEEMVTAAAKTSANVHLIVLLGGDAGLRGGEMRALEWSDVNLKKRQLRIERNDWKGQVSSTKGNRVRWVPLTRRLAAALQQHRHLRGARVLCHADGKPLAEHHVVDLLAKVGRRANVRSNGPHILRHHADSRIMPTAVGRPLGVGGDRAFPNVMVGIIRGVRERRAVDPSAGTDLASRRPASYAPAPAL